MATKKLNTEIFYTILVVSIAVFWGMGFVFIPWAQQSNAPSSLILSLIHISEPTRH